MAACDRSESVIAIGLGLNEVSQIVKEEEDVLGIGDWILSRMKKALGVADDKDLSAIRCKSDSMRVIVLVGSIKTPIHGPH